MTVLAEAPPQLGGWAQGDSRTNSRDRCRVIALRPADPLTREDVVALLAEANRRGWDHRAGTVLLRHAERITRPVVRNVAQRHHVTEDGLFTAGLTAAWQALRRYDPSRSPDPWGWVARAVRLAAVDAALMVRTCQPARNRARCAAAIVAAARRLTDELGRSPTAAELVAGVTPSAQMLIRSFGITHDPLAFVHGAAPMLTYDDAMLDRPVEWPNDGQRCAGRSWRAITETVAAQTGLSWDRSEAAVDLAADLYADLLPSLTSQATRTRVAAELSHAPESIRLSPRQARAVVNALLSAVRAGGDEDRTVCAAQATDQTAGALPEGERIPCNY